MSTFPVGTVQLSYKRVGDLNVPAAFIPAPASSISIPRPLLLFAHGGALIAGSYVNFAAEWLDLAHARGWHFLSFSYQLMPPGNADTLISDVTDLGRWVSADLNEALRSRGADASVDLSRIIAAGHSAGGFVAYQCGRLFPEAARPRVVFTLSAMSNDWGQPTSSGWYTNPKPDGTKWVMTEEPITRHKAEDFAEFIARKDPITEFPFERLTPTEDRFTYFEYLIASGTFAQVYGFKNGTVIPHMNKSYPSTILVHGNSDTVVPLSDSEAVVAKLDSLSVKSKLFVVEGGDHYMDTGGPEVVAAFNVVEEWLHE
ncbi:Alpha/Beta hydrolase protein [Cladochytrium replicatum]|nr:Alpha/Beta hydrolase protein [Cladochytrium replicatum]